MTSAEAQALWISMKVSLLSILFAAGPGILLGIWLARTRSIFRGAIETAVLLPMLLPPVATGFLVLLLLVPDGPLGSVFDSLFGLRLVLRWPAAGIACSLLALPFVVQSVRAGVEAVDPEIEGIARTLGASRMRVLRTITLPLAWRSVAVGLLLGWCRSFGEFGATLVVAGNTPGKTQTLPLLLFNLYETGKDGPALRVVAIVALVALVAVALSTRFRRATG